MSDKTIEIKLLSTFPESDSIIYSEVSNKLLEEVLPACPTDLSCDLKEKFLENSFNETKTDYHLSLAICASQLRNELYLELFKARVRIKEIEIEIINCNEQYQNNIDLMNKYNGN